jgi:hypothetical protein
MDLNNILQWMDDNNALALLQATLALILKNKEPKR